MTKEFVPYELALKLKELGFDEEGFCNWEESWSPEPEDEIRMVLTTDQTWLRPGWICAPIFSQAFRWFRDKHDLFGKIEVLNFGADEYCFEIYNLFEEKTIYDNFQGAAASYTGTFNTYEESELACLEKLIEIVTKQQEQ